MAEAKGSKKKKIGLALGSGAAKGLAHIGVLAELEKQGIQPDLIAGTSMGALIGAVYAQGVGSERMKEIARGFGQKRLSLFVEPSVPRSSLIRGQKIAEALRVIIGEVDFSSLEIPFVCLATDIGDGREIVIDQGEVWRGVMASCSIPILLPPVKKANRYLVDGGLVSPIPARILRDLGADVVIGVSVSSKGQEDVDWGNRRDGSKGPNLFDIAFQTMNLIGFQASKNCLPVADIVIEPNVDHIGWADFHRVDECILEGERAARNSMKQILSLAAN
ncbi:patatin-like phospholipase family protein [Dehalogenimonas alkenigignens]|uniref:Putative esterase of the alpha-beta hydrolase superfamily n=2 Tax=Dehalogenimonas alkenigignens TaxID=1217799 RepID=A0A0W0GLA4_9CHLR|nr:patatin-like phospholipase family protein [Dehalogenimonas alkenigignens]KTB49340.1 putative esterase of the alpha-beta hydrolase superfamily [Dehalogenimonas alkenigignens]PVV83780.1 patatin family protein [Dehalogenimonas alkenigignens]